MDIQLNSEYIIDGTWQLTDDWKERVAKEGPRFGVWVTNRKAAL